MQGHRLQIFLPKNDAMLELLCQKPMHTMRQKGEIEILQRRESLHYKGAKEIHTEDIR